MPLLNDGVIMEEWKEYKLGEVAIQVRDRIETSCLDSSTYISTENMLPNKAGITLSSGIPSGNAIKFKNGDILISNIRPYFKKIWRADKNGGCSADVICLRASNEVEPLFLYYLLSQDLFFDYVMQGAKGTKMPRGDKNQIMQWPISIPSKTKQNKIASMLSSLDVKIEVNRRINDNFVIEPFFEILLIWAITTLINDNLEQQAQALFKSWFVDFEPFRNQPFVESEMGLIPNGWQVGTLADITQQKSEKVGQQEDVKVLSPVTTGKLMLSEEYFTKQVFSESIAKYKVVEIGDFAYNPARVNIGSIGRNEYGYRGCVSPVYVVFSCKDGYAYFFDLFRKTEKFQTEVKARAIGGVRQSLNYTDFGFIQTVIAPTSVMEKFNPFYKKIQAAQKHLEEENSRLSSLRDTLLPRLMSGELKVCDVIL